MPLNKKEKKIVEKQFFEPFLFSLLIYARLNIFYVNEVG